ncbi:MAG: effector binding domain-containing protein [Ramlibacter sp.]|nr:effector binding domain-containing protein [Ramlibacter sp.]
MQIIEQDRALHVVGIELRTHNAEAFQTIPPHWQRFGQDGVVQRVPDRLSQDVYAVYTHFENAGRNNQGLYSLVIGAAVPASAPVPDGMVRVVVPASRRAVFPVPPGRPDLVGEQWQAIWQRHDLRKTFVAEYERYGPEGRIEILVGIERDGAAE